MIDPKNLGSPLEEIVTEFGAACTRRMARRNATAAPTNNLFHYTNEEAFKNIIKTEQFWFTSIYYMDDPEELNFGFDVAGSILKSAWTAGDKVVRLFCEPFLEAGFREDVRSIVEFYSMSFGIRDNRRQWRQYGDAGKGVAIGLAPIFFRKAEDHVYVGKVVYGIENARARHRRVIKSAINLIKRQYQAGAIPNGKVAQALYRRMAAEIYVEILWNCVTTKSDSWSHQNEYRMLALNRTKQPHWTIHNADIRPRVEIKQPNLKRDLKEVVIGPKADTEAETRIRSFLQENGVSAASINRSVVKDLRL